MSPIHFLDLPFSVRHQIYAELLVPSFAKDIDDRYVYNETTTSIFHVNRAIYAESSAVFYNRNLFVVVRSNSSQAFAELTSEKTPVFARVKNRSSIAQCPRFALSVELRSIKTLALVQSTSPAYVITSEALPLFFPALVGPIKYSDNYRFGNFTNTGAIALFRPFPAAPFRYTPSRFSELTFGRLATLADGEYPRFSALRVESDSISPAHRSALMRWCDTSCWPLDSVYVPWAINRLIQVSHLGGRFDAEQKEYPREYFSCDEISAAFHQMLETIDVYWECSAARIQLPLPQLEQICFHEEDEAVTKRRLYRSLYNVVLSLCNELVRQVFAVAKRHPSRSKASYTEARRMAEAGIQYLNRNERAMGWLPYRSQRDGNNVGVIDEDDEQWWRDIGEDENEFSEANTMLHLKAARACKKLGDFAAAEDYLKDARATPYLSAIVAEKGKSLSSSFNVYKTNSGLGVQPLKTTKAVLWRRRKVAGENSVMIDRSDPTYQTSLLLLERHAHLVQLWIKTPL